MIAQYMIRAGSAGVARRCQASCPIFEQAGAVGKLEINLQGGRLVAHMLVAAGFAVLVENKGI